MSPSDPPHQEPTRDPAAPAAPTPGPVPSGEFAPLPKAQAAAPLAIPKAPRRRWLDAALLGMMAAGAAFAGVWFYLPPPQYCATAKFLISSKPEGILFDHPEAKTDYSTFVDTQMAVIKSHMVLTAALRRPEVKVLPEYAAVAARGLDPVDWLDKQVLTDFPNGKEILRLSIYSDDDKTCKTLVTAVKDAYLEEVTNQARKRRQERLDELDALTAKYEAKVKTLREDLHARAKVLGGGSDLALKLKQLEAHDELQRARRDLVDVGSRLRKLETEAKLARDRAALREEARKQLQDQAVANSAGRENQLQQEIESAQALRDRLQRDIVQLSKDAQEFNEAVVEFDDLKPQIVEAEGVAMRAAEERQKLAIEQLDPLRVTPWEGGEVIVSRPDDMSRRASMAGMGAGGAFVVAALLIVLRKFWARRISAVPSP